MKIDEKDMEDYAEFLINLRDSGVTNMYGAAPFLEDEFDIDHNTASKVLSQWMQSF